MVSTMIRQTPVTMHRLQVCRQWSDFNYAAQNPVTVDLWSVLSSYECEAENRPGARAMLETLAGLPKIGMLRQACAGDPVLAAAVAVMLKDFANKLRDGLDKIPMPEPSAAGTGEEGTGDGDGEDSAVDQAVESAVHQAAKHLDPDKAMDRVKQTNRGYSLFGDGLTIEERIALQQVNLQRLQRILSMVGVMREVTTETVRTIRAEAPYVSLPKPGYRGGMSALGMLQPGELANIAAGGSTEALFWKRWRNDRARVTRTLAKVPAGSGPMVVLGDESWSMRGDVKFTGLPDSTSLDWLMSLVLAVADQCKSQGRTCVYRGWSSDVPDSRRFEGLSVSDRIALIEQPLGNGTNLVLAMEYGLQELRKLSRPRQRGDLLVITDGSWHLGHVRTEAFIRALQEVNSRAHLLLVEQSSKVDVPKNGLWESVHYVEDLLESSTIVGKALA